MNEFLKQFDTVSNSEKGAKLHFNLPSGDPAFVDIDSEKPCKPLTVTMLGTSSKAHDALATQVIRDLRAEAKISRNKSKKEKEADADNVSETLFCDIAETQVKRLVAVVQSWENFNDSDGKAMPCTKENVKNIFESCKDLRIQAINFLESDVNFING